MATIKSNGLRNGSEDLETSLTSKREISQELREHSEKAWGGKLSDKFDQFDGLYSGVVFNVNNLKHINLAEFDPDQIIKEVYGDATEDTDPEDSFNDL